MRPQSPNDRSTASANSNILTLADFFIYQTHIISNVSTAIDLVTPEMVASDASLRKAIEDLQVCSSGVNALLENYKAVFETDNLTAPRSDLEDCKIKNYLLGVGRSLVALQFTADALINIIRQKNNEPLLQSASGIFASVNNASIVNDESGNSVEYKKNI